MNQTSFLEYLDICTNAFTKTIKELNLDYRKSVTDEETQKSYTDLIGPSNYKYVILNSINVTDITNKKIEITVECLRGGYGILKNKIPEKIDPKSNIRTYNKSVHKYLEDSFTFDDLQTFANNKIKFLSQNGKFADSDIEYITEFFNALSKRKKAVSPQYLWTYVIKAVFEEIQNNSTNSDSDFSKNYSDLMLAELSTFFAEYSDVFNGITGQADDFYSAASSLYLKLFLISTMDIGLVCSASVYRISPASVFAEEDCRRYKISPVLNDSAFSSFSKETEEKIISMIKALVSKTAEMNCSNIDYNAFHVILGDLFFKISNNYWCQENVILPMMNNGEKSALIFATIFNKAAAVYLKEEWDIPCDMYRLDRSYASYCAFNNLDKFSNANALPNVTDTFVLNNKSNPNCFKIMRFKGDPLKEIKKINEGKDENSYAQNRKFFIKATNQELIAAAQKGDLYAVYDKKKSIVVGFAIMTVDTDTSDPKNRTPYNGGKMKAALESINIYESDYGVLNTVIIDPDYYEYGLQHILTLLLIRMCRKRKKYIVATVSNKNKYSYRNFMKCRFTDIDKDNELSGSVVYNIDGKKYPRHLVILKTNEHNSYPVRLDLIAFMSYAKQFHEMRNCNYEYYEGRNCQNYVSQCLVAAGWKFDNEFYPKSLAFVNVGEFQKYAVRKGLEYIEGIDDISQGDLLITDNGGHIMIVQAVMQKNEETVIYAAGNTNNRDMFIVDHKLITGYIRISILF